MTGARHETRRPVRVMTTPGPMRVLMTADAAGGVWGYTVELARALAAQGDETHVAVMGGRLTPSMRAELESIPRCRLFESELKLPWMPDAWGDVARAGEWLLDLAASISPDAVHVNHDVYGGL